VRSKVSKGVKCVTAAVELQHYGTANFMNLKFDIIGVGVFVENTN